MYFVYGPPPRGDWDTGNCSSPSNKLSVTPNDFRPFPFFFGIDLLNKLDNLMLAQY